MTKKINKVRILERLRDRYDLEDFEKEDFLVIEKLILVDDIGKLLQEVETDNTNLDLTGGGSAYVVAFTVPAGKRWTLWGYVREGTTANSQVYVYDTDSTPQGFQLAGGATAAGRELNLNLPMPEGWSIGMVETGNGADGSINLAILYIEEDAF